eukprot:3440639-Lingulodinium_polyedra.AAC.1
MSDQLPLQCLRAMVLQVRGRSDHNVSSAAAIALPGKTRRRGDPDLQHVDPVPPAEPDGLPGHLVRDLATSGVESYHVASSGQLGHRQQGLRDVSNLERQSTGMAFPSGEAHQLLAPAGHPLATSGEILLASQRRAVLADLMIGQQSVRDDRLSSAGVDNHIERPVVLELPPH